MSLSLLDPKEWTVQDAAMANRIVEGLFGVVMATRSIACLFSVQSTLHD